MKIKKYIVCLILMFSVLYGASGISAIKTHDTLKHPVEFCGEVGVGI